MICVTALKIMFFIYIFHLINQIWEMYFNGSIIKQSSLSRRSYFTLENVSWESLDYFTVLEFYFMYIQTKNKIVWPNSYFKMGHEKQFYIVKLHHPIVIWYGKCLQCKQHIKQSHWDPWLGNIVTSLNFT